MSFSFFRSSLKEHLFTENFPFCDEVVGCDEGKAVVFRNFLKLEMLSLHDLDVIEVNLSVCLLKDNIAVMKVERWDRWIGLEEIEDDLSVLEIASFKV